MILDIMSIPLTRGLYALVDGKNYEWLNQYKWCAYKGRNTYYAIRTVGKYPTRYKIWMHRQILNTPPRMQTDHLNHCGLDNRNVNIRICTRNQNHQNELPRKKCSSKYKGVYWWRNKKWLARIRYNKKRIHLGLFDDEIEAALAYDRKAKELFGEFANTNF